MRHSTLRRTTFALAAATATTLGTAAVAGDERDFDHDQSRQIYCLCDSNSSQADLNLYSYETNAYIRTAESFYQYYDSYYGSNFLDRCYARMRQLPVCR